MDSDRKSVLMLHAAVMLFGLSAVLGRWISVPAVCVAGGRVVCSTLVLLILCRWKKIPTCLNSFRDGCFTVIAGVVLAVHWTTFFMAVQTASVAVGTITFSTFPLFVTFLEPVVFRERFQARGVLCACVLIAGVLITVPEFAVENETTLGILWGLVSSFSYAILALFNRDLSAKYAAQTVCLYEQGTAAVALLPFLFLTNASWSVQDLGGIALLGVACTALAHGLYVAAQKRVKAQTAGIISGMETVYGILYAMLLLGEIPTPREWIGGGVILAAAIFASIGKN